MKKDNNYCNCIELFAGAGGVSLGLEKANIDTLMYVEIDKDCCKTLNKNRPHWNIKNIDIYNVDWKKELELLEIDSIDIVTGGFPCQAFSYAGKRLGFEDTRGTLFYEFARCVKETKPYIFMAENVKGLITHNEGKTFETIIDVFKELGYEISWKLLNAYHYGVPQKRERVIIIGIRNDISKDKVSFIWPKECEEKERKTLEKALKDCPSSIYTPYSDKKRKIMELVPQGGNWRDLPIEIQKEYMGKAFYSGGGKTGIAKRLSLNEPSPTILCSPCQKQTERCHPIETRPLTIRESARIQTFDDDWDFCGGISSQYKQIGNAVPVLLVQKIGEQLKEFVIKVKILNK